MPKVDLILLERNGYKIAWEFGHVWVYDEVTEVVTRQILRDISATESLFVLFWDSALGQPNSDELMRISNRPGDLWHAGLCLGGKRLPEMIDFVAPTWMLNLDPPVDVEATSWRVTWRACLARTEVLRQMGFVRPEFRTLEAAFLEWGHRCITGGIIVRHVPELVSEDGSSRISKLPFEDELRFIDYRFGRKWAWWALLRAVLSGHATPKEALFARNEVFNGSPPASPPHFKRNLSRRFLSSRHPAQRFPTTISVLIPTLERYPYLITLLSQLRQQTIPPHEIIIVDQTPTEKQDKKIYEEFADLPLKILYLDKTGQCSSRNTGIQDSTGTHILFLDDDDEIPPGLIEKHLGTLSQYASDVSSGVVEEIGAGALPHDFTYLRVSNVFPTNNTLVKKETLGKSGLFDLAYEYGPRADGDLGTRIYLSGALMILNPEISVLHHHALRGGLRAHKSRVVTYASSRQSIIQRHLPSVTEIYLVKRYFTAQQVREFLWLRVLGTFSHKGTNFQQLIKIVISLALLPHTIWIMRKRARIADQMLRSYPQIPSLKQKYVPVSPNAISK